MKQEISLIVINQNIIKKIYYDYNDCNNQIFFVLPP